MKIEAKQRLLADSQGKNLVEVAYDLAVRAPTKQNFINAMMGYFVDCGDGNNPSEEEKATIFNLLGISKGIKIEDFKTALGKFYVKNRDARKERKWKFARDSAEIEVDNLLRKYGGDSYREFADKEQAEKSLTAMKTEVQLETANGELWNTHYNGPFENAQKHFTGKYVSESTDKDPNKKVVKVHFISTEGN